MTTRTLLLSLCLILPVGVASASTQGESVETERQPRMKKALKHLQAAKNSLKMATHDKGGHRVAAIGQVKLAIDHVRKGIAFDNKNETEVEPPNMELQPLMRSALKHLKQARKKLKKATHDKGGHRVKALGYVNSAIDRVQKGIAHDNKN